MSKFKKVAHKLYSVERHSEFMENFINVQNIMQKFDHITSKNDEDLLSKVLSNIAEKDDLIFFKKIKLMHNKSVIFKCLFIYDKDKNDRNTYHAANKFDKLPFICPFGTILKHSNKIFNELNDYDEKDELNYNILCKYKGNEWKADCIEYAMKTCNINFLNHICKHIRFKMHHSDKFAKYIFDIFPHHYNYRHININFAQYILSNEFLKMINVNENEFDEVRFDLLTHTKPDWEEGESAFMQMVRNDSNEKNIKLIKMTLNLIKSDEKKMKLIHYVYKNNNQNEDDNNMDEYYRYNEYDNNQVEYDIFTFYDSKKKNIEAIQNIEADLTTDLLKNKVEVIQNIEANLTTDLPKNKIDNIEWIDNAIKNSCAKCDKIKLTQLYKLKFENNETKQDDGYFEIPTKHFHKIFTDIDDDNPEPNIEFIKYILSKEFIKNIGLKYDEKKFDKYKNRLITTEIRVKQVWVDSTSYSDINSTILMQLIEKLGKNTINNRDVGYIIELIKILINNITSNNDKTEYITFCQGYYYMTEFSAFLTLDHYLKKKKNDKNMIQVAKYLWNICVDNGFDFENWQQDMNKHKDISQLFEKIKQYK